MTEYAATQAFYGRWAQLYDLVATAPGVGSWRAAAADALALEPGDTVLEMGCGTGANLPYLRERVGEDGTVIGLDITPGMLATARERVASAGWANVHLARADARRPPTEGPVDAVLGAFVVGMFADPATVVGDWIEVLAEDGSIALLNATRSASPLAAPLNLAFRAFVRLSTPGGGGERDDVAQGKAAGNRPDAARSPMAVLESRIAAATAALEARTTSSDARRLAGGFVSLRWGHGPVSDPQSFSSGHRNQRP